MKKQSPNTNHHSASRFTITTLGCKVNQYESDALAQSLTSTGCIHAGSEENADLCIINTCTVTQKASMQSRQAIRRAVRSNPGARIIVTGCYAQTEPDEIRKIKGIDCIVGHSDKHTIPEIVRSRDKEHRHPPPCPEVVWRDIGRERDFKLMPAVPGGTRTRPFLKIQDGCDAFCTYCIVPYARGRSRSMPPENVLEHMEELKTAGYKEVVLTGVHLGCYGTDLSPKTDLGDLLTRIRHLDLIERVRLSSIEPHELTEDIIGFVAESDMFCHHFHIPLQSGDDHILKKMNRPYTNRIFRERVLDIHHMLPDAAVGVDVLIGFPGETETSFENTYSLINELPVSYLHVFPFSPRHLTPAGRYPDQVPSKLIKERSLKMRELGRAKRAAFYKKFTGKTVEILVEEKRTGSEDFLKGITSNYVPVLFKGEDTLKNTLVTVRIENVSRRNSVYGTVC